MARMPVLKCFASLGTGRNMEEEENICFSFVKKNQNFEILQPGILTTATRKAFKSSFTGNGAGDDESQENCVIVCSLHFRMHGHKWTGDA